MKETAVHTIGARLRDYVNNSASGTAEFSAGSCGYYLKFFNRFKSDIDRRALPAQLFAEEAVVVVSAIQTDIVENTTLSGKSDLIAVRSLNHAYSWRECQQVFKLAAQNRG